jgi:hypothetical protein
VTAIGSLVHIGAPGRAALPPDPVVDALFDPSEPPSLHVAWPAEVLCPDQPSGAKPLEEGCSNDPFFTLLPFTEAARVPTLFVSLDSATASVPTVGGRAQGVIALDALEIPREADVGRCARGERRRVEGVDCHIAVLELRARGGGRPAPVFFTVTTTVTLSPCFGFGFDVVIAVTWRSGGAAFTVTTVVAVSEAPSPSVTPRRTSTGALVYVCVTTWPDASSDPLPSVSHAYVRSSGACRSSDEPLPSSVTAWPTDTVAGFACAAAAGGVLPI